MKLYFDLAKERLLSVPRGGEINLIHIKAGGSVELEIDFYNGKVSTAPAFTPLIQFAIKTSEEGTLLALADTDAFTGSGAFYGGTLLTNTAEIVTWLDGASSKLAVAELTIQDGAEGIPIRSQTLTVRVANHVIRGDEGTTGTLPSADAYLAARSVLYDRAQTLTDPQKAQARANIGIASASDAFGEGVSGNEFLRMDGTGGVRLAEVVIGTASFAGSFKIGNGSGGVNEIVPSAIAAVYTLPARAGTLAVGIPEYATLAAANAAIAAIGVVFYNLATSRHEVTTDVA